MANKAAKAGSEKWRTTAGNASAHHPQSWVGLDGGRLGGTIEFAPAAAAGIDDGKIPKLQKPLP
jgi:hypothetical protein